MKKASRILFIVGFIYGVFNLIFLVAMTVWSFMISAPGYTQTLIGQLKDGSLHSDFPGTFEEQAAQIQHIFLIMAIVFIVISIVTAASIVIANFAKRTEYKIYSILSIVLGVLTGNILFVIASIFLLVINARNVDGETINVSY